MADRRAERRRQDDPAPARPRARAARRWAARSSTASRRTGSAVAGVLGYLPQRAQLGGEAPATVREVVAAGRLPRGGLVGPLRAGDRAASTRRSRGSAWPTARETPLRTLSGGMQQRAFIAKALAAEPSLLVARRADDRRRRRPRRRRSRRCSTAAPRARRDDPLRLARVRGGGALRAAAGARARRASSSTARRPAPRASGTTPHTSMLELEFMRLALRRRRSRRRARAGRRLLPRRTAPVAHGRRHRPRRVRRRGRGHLLEVRRCCGARRSRRRRAGARVAPHAAVARRPIRRSRSSSTPGSRWVSSSSRSPARSTSSLFPYLFGSILTVTRGDVALVAVLGAAALATIGLLLRRLARRRPGRGGRAGRRRAGRIPQRRRRRTRSGHGRRLDAGRRACC